MSKTVDEITDDLVLVACKFVVGRLDAMRRDMRNIAADALAQQREADARLVDGFLERYGRAPWPALEAVAVAIRAGGETK